MGKKAYFFRYEEGSDIDRWLEHQERKGVSLEQAIRIVIANLGDRDVMQALAQSVNIGSTQQRQQSVDLSDPEVIKDDDITPSPDLADARPNIPDVKPSDTKEKPKSSEPKKNDSDDGGNGGDIDMGMLSSL